MCSSPANGTLEQTRQEKGFCNAQGESVHYSAATRYVLLAEVLGAGTEVGGGDLPHGRAQVLVRIDRCIA